MIWLYISISIVFGCCVGLMIREYQIVKVQLQWLDYIKTCLNSGAMTYAEVDDALDIFEKISDLEALFKFWKPIKSFLY